MGVVVVVVVVVVAMAARHRERGGRASRPRALSAGDPPGDVVPWLGVGVRTCGLGVGRSFLSGDARVGDTERDGDVVFELLTSEVHGGGGTRSACTGTRAVSQMASSSTACPATSASASLSASMSLASRRRRTLSLMRTVRQPHKPTAISDARRTSP